MLPLYLHVEVQTHPNLLPCSRRLTRYSKGKRKQEQAKSRLSAEDTFVAAVNFMSVTLCIIFPFISGYLE